MSTDSVKDLGPLFFAEQDRLLGGPADELCAPGYTAQIGVNPPMPLAGHQQFARMFYAAFPDLRHVIEETVAEPDRVAVRFTLRGTQTGDFMGLPAPGGRSQSPRSPSWESLAARSPSSARCSIRWE